MAKKILVVDDEKLIVKGIRFSLEQDSYEVDAAYDGEEALEKAKTNRYDLIMLDLMLPKMSGLDVCREIREFSNVPIIMLTAKGEDMDKSRRGSRQSSEGPSPTRRRRRTPRSSSPAIFASTRTTEESLCRAER